VRRARPAGWRTVVAVVLAAATAVVVIRAEVAETVRISSDSMVPTLARGDDVLVEKVTPRLGRVRRGDLVVFTDPKDGEPALKRVVGLAGDTVEIRDAVLFVNSERAVEPQVDLAAYDGAWFGPARVPAGQLFVLGDNRAHSVDSRAYGGVPEEDVDGRVLWRLP
jgi:signal peptidase I